MLVIHLAHVTYLVVSNTLHLVGKQKNVTIRRTT